MPELPEVETIRRQLAPLVEGRELAHVQILDERWSRPHAPSDLAAALERRRVQQLGRRGKYLLWALEDDVYLAQHLRMTGALLYEPVPEPSHVRVRLLLRDGAGEHRLVVDDPRRFGMRSVTSSPPALAWSHWTRALRSSTCGGRPADGGRR